VVRPVEAFRGRFLSESIALAEAHAKELGYEPTVDPDLVADLRDIMNSRKPRDLHKRQRPACRATLARRFPAISNGTEP
jgi:hypothetical protein